MSEQAQPGTETPETPEEPAPTEQPATDAPTEGDVDGDEAQQDTGALQ